MPHMITRFSIHKTSMVMAVTYMALGILFGAIFLIGSVVQGQMMAGLVMLIIFPIIYGVIGYVMAAFLCWLYNFIAKGGTIGVTFETKEVE